MNDSDRSCAARGSDPALVLAQLGRTPRMPWRVAARCGFGRPTVIVSPSRLADGTPFPTYAWLTCPHLVERVGLAESAGGAADFAARALRDPLFESSLRVLDTRVRELRAVESAGVDACPAVGVGGQRDPLGVKCLHVHVALTLLGEDDPIGSELLSEIPRECEEDRCALLCETGAPEEGT